MNSTTLAFLFGGWASTLPALWRKRIYTTVKVLAMLGTLALLVIPELPSLGINWTGSQVAVTVVTGILAFLGHLAQQNTAVDPTMVDVNPAPETNTPVNPADLAAGK